MPAPTGYSGSTLSLAAAELIDTNGKACLEPLADGLVLKPPRHADLTRRLLAGRRPALVTAIIGDVPVGDDQTPEPVDFAQQIMGDPAVEADTDGTKRLTVDRDAFDDRVGGHHRPGLDSEGSLEGGHVLGEGVVIQARNPTVVVVSVETLRLGSIADPVFHDGQDTCSMNTTCRAAST